MDESFLQAAVHCFTYGEKVPEITPLAGGHINRSYLVSRGAQRLVLQSLNAEVFPDPQAIVGNYAQLIDHLARRQQPGRPLLAAELISTLDGAHYWRDPAGVVWRAQRYLTEHQPPQSVQLRSLGQILARFHGYADTIDIRRLAVPIPGFHHTSAYLAVCDRELAEAAENTAELGYCRRIIVQLRPQALVLERVIHSGRLPPRLIHGDPKRENFIINNAGKALGLLDLDTAGAGCLAHDLGDCLRSLCNPASEEASADQASFDLARCEQVLRGYGEEARHYGSGADLEYVFEGVLLIAFELAVRFLTDHLQGDSYFRVQQHGDNLQRAIGQFRLAEIIAGQEKAIRRLAAEAVIGYFPSL